MTTPSGWTDARSARSKLVSTWLYLIPFFIDKKRLEKRERLLAKEQDLLGAINVKQQALHEARAVLIEGLPENYNQLMLQELVKHYPGLQDYQLRPEKQSAVVSFSTHEEAQVALAGNYTLYVLSLFV
jgi:RNA recognition motif. (a.k.a. RRM, RBD, or RNP domain)